MQVRTHDFCYMQQLIARWEAKNKDQFGTLYFRGVTTSGQCVLFRMLLWTLSLHSMWGLDASFCKVRQSFYCTVPASWAVLTARCYSRLQETLTSCVYTIGKRKQQETSNWSSWETPLLNSPMSVLHATLLQWSAFGDNFSVISL